MATAKKVSITYGGKTRVVNSNTTIRILRSGNPLVVRIAELIPGDLVGCGPLEPETGARNMVPVTKVVA